MMMTSPTHGRVTIPQVCTLIADFIVASPRDRYVIGIGTDSQNFDYTKVVSAVYAHRVGYGAIAFYDIQRIPKVNNIHQKMLMETGDSIRLADAIVGELSDCHTTSGRRFDLNDYGLNAQKAQVFRLGMNVRDL